jgi:hypothetical protein
MQECHDWHQFDLRASLAEMPANEGPRGDGGRLGDTTAGGTLSSAELRPATSSSAAWVRLGQTLRRRSSSPGQAQAQRDFAQTPVCKQGPQGQRHKASQAVFGVGNLAVRVVDSRKKPLRPCGERRARLLLERRPAVIDDRGPLTIRLNDRTGGEVRPARVKPGRGFPGRRHGAPERPTGGSRRRAPAAAMAVRAVGKSAMPGVDAVVTAGCDKSRGTQGDVDAGMLSEVAGFRRGIFP